MDVAGRSVGNGDAGDAIKMGRKKDSGGRKATPLYSREDIREQYCINSKEPDSGDCGLRRSKGFFGCFSSKKVIHLNWIRFAPSHRQEMNEKK